MTKPITIWRRFDKQKEEWFHNHIEDHHVSRLEPKPASKEQKEKWEGALWHKEYGYLIDNKVYRTEDIDRMYKGWADDCEAGRRLREVMEDFAIR